MEITERLVREHTAYSVVVGSRAYGLDDEDSDTDRRGVFVAPTPLFWRLDPPPTHADGPLPEQFSWELARFCELALAANPTVLECLWSPIVEVSTPVGDRLRALRRSFLSIRVKDSYLGYAASQLHRVERQREHGREVHWKHVMHCLRLLLSGERLMTTGEPMVQVGDLRDRLLAVKRGEVGWFEVQAWRASVAARVEEAAASAPLPEHPNRAAVDDFLFEVRKEGAR